MREELRYELKDLLGIGFTIIVLGIGIAYGLDVNKDIKDDFGEDHCSARADSYTLYNDSSGLCYNSTGTQIRPTSFQFNASTDTGTGVSKLTEKLPTIATVVVASVVIGILVTYLWARFAKM